VASRSRKQAGHEGARESSAPGRPRERDVITPDWAHLDKNSPSHCVPGTDDDQPAPATRDDEADAPAPPMKGPAIDRHR
jgi:hypothetical protein